MPQILAVWVPGADSNEKIIKQTEREEGAGAGGGVWNWIAGRISQPAVNRL